MEGNIIIRNGRLYNTISRRGYAGTGSWFYEDFDGYIKNKIIPESSLAQNNHNYDQGTGMYKFLFSVKGEEVTIYYFDHNRSRVNLHSFTLNNY